MLNGRRFNGAGLNGAAVGAILVLSAATFSADATVTASATQNHAMVIDTTIQTFVTFSADKNQYAHFSQSAGGVSTFRAITDWSAESNWVGTTNFQPLVYRIVQAQVGFDTTSAFEALANSKLGTAAWTSGAADAGLTFTPTHTGALAASLSAGAELAPDGSLTTRIALVEGDWAGTVTAHMEATYYDDVADITYHDGFMDEAITSTWLVESGLNVVFINEFNFDAGASVLATSMIIHAGVADWAPTAVLTPDASKVAFPTTDWTAGTSNLLLLGGQIRAAEATTLAISPTFEAEGFASMVGSSAWALDIDFASAPMLTHAMNLNMTTTTTAIASGIRVAMGSLLLSNTSALIMNGLGTFSGNVSMAGSTGTVIASAVVSTVEAPASRRYNVSGDSRIYAVSGDGLTERTFEVSG